MPAMMPGRTQRQRDGQEDPDRPGAERRRRLLELAVDRLDRQADAADHQRKTHDGAGKGGAGPAEGKDEAEYSARKAPTGAAPAEEDQQQKTGDDRRQHQRQVNHAVEERLAPEPSARQDHRNGDRERQARQHGDDGNAQAETDRRPFRVAQSQSSPNAMLRFLQARR